MVVVAAVDDSEQAAAVLNEANVLAKQFDDTVHVLHVMTRPEALEADGEQIDDPGDVQAGDELRSRAKRVAAELVNTSSIDADVVPVGRIGDPASSITNYANTQDTRYIVVSPQKRTQTGKVLFGSVAQSVILDADCPVVSLRPDTV
ncbi:universal stress protein [Halobellus sp. Atlit-38R]|uniref:universal stress protein n=1 Tax=Halobellus sp. Atlit-38R TaxID=2282131 RepID=UPI000EF28B86|nr:universal stress protein [Halobellus sp. Atlit-38R]RLM87935.1 universal stress protein [Halobellus sp. Atlit-38R]